MKFCFFLKRKVQIPFLSPFPENRDAFLPSPAVLKNVVCIRLPETYRDPVPGVIDPYLYGSGIVRFTDVAVLPVQGRAGKTCSWQRGFPSACPYVFCLPVLYPGAVRWDTAEGFCNSSPAVIRRELIKTFPEIILYFWTFCGSNGQPFHGIDTFRLVLQYKEAFLREYDPDEEIHGIPVPRNGILEYLVVTADPYRVCGVDIHKKGPPLISLISLICHFSYKTAGFYKKIFL